MLEELDRNGIIPNATLYHWDLPWELERRGGWLNRDCVEWYGEYVSCMFREFGDQIPFWVTFNEPITTYVGYGAGGFDYRFGMIHVDFDTQERIWKDSGFWYADFVEKREFEF